MNDDILLTREQIGQALEYADPSKAIRKIHLNHKDRLDELCVRIKLGSTQNGANLSKSEEQARVYYTERGIMEICRWSRQKQANVFMDWVWDIISKYRHDELNINTAPDLQPLIDAITTLTQTVSTMQQDISSLKESSVKKKIPEKKYSRWKTNTFEKLNLLTDYVNEHSDQELRLSDTMHIILNEVQDTYNIEFSDYIKDYMFETECEDRPYDLDVVKYYKDIRNMYDATLDSTLERLNLELPKANRNIFDELADKIAL
jgi:prophage antirepressor-like protein